MESDHKHHQKLKPGYKWVFCTRFFHRGAKRYIVAAPGKVFRFMVPINKR